jgi:hypothetical protein
VSCEVQIQKKMMAQPVLKNIHVISWHAHLVLVAATMLLRVCNLC